MKRFRLSVSRLSMLLTLVALSIALAPMTWHVSAQKNNDRTNKQKSTPASAGATTTPADNDYSRKIKEYTTEPYFRTELVDHLPMSDKVPSPDKVLGYIVGTPNKLTYTKD